MREKIERRYVGDYEESEGYIAICRDEDVEQLEDDYAELETIIHDKETELITVREINNQQSWALDRLEEQLKTSKQLRCELDTETGIIISDLRDENFKLEKQRDELREDGATIAVGYLNLVKTIANDVDGEMPESTIMSIQQLEEWIKNTSGKTYKQLLARIKDSK